MPRTLQRATPSGVHDSALAQAHWCSTRLIYHGWKMLEMGCDENGGYFTAVDHDGATVTVHGTAPCDTQRSLQSQLCAALTVLAHQGSRKHTDSLHYLSIMLRLGRPAARLRGEDLWPWPIPDSSIAVQPTTGIRTAYWLSSILSDDYCWHIVTIDAGGFNAIPPGQPIPERHASPTVRGTVTTAAQLVAELSKLSEGEITALAALVERHRRRRQGQSMHEVQR